MAMSSRERVEAIESWCVAHEDGDFSVCSSDHPSVRNGDSTEARSIIYTTKIHCLSRIRGLANLRQPVASLGRNGLPLQDDLSYVRGASDSVTRLFIGDADPPDLLAFAWVREHVPITWLGVSDEFLDHQGNLKDPQICIRLSQTAAAAVAALPDLCPGYRDCVGPYCSSLLDSGLKIELEGAMLNVAGSEV